jgi:hypothetical protein
MGKKLEKALRRISSLEAEGKASKQIAAQKLADTERIAAQKVADAEREKALEHAVRAMPFVDDPSHDLVLTFYRTRVERDKDTGQFMIDGVPLEAFMASEIPEKYPNLLRPKNEEVDVSGRQREAGGKAAAKPAIDYDALNSQSGKETLDAAAKQIAAVLARSN